eukprot:TRINITY_DN6659_c0_g1_i1.p1 TRINITY_DN6659_c0_g1~~TRINITY_DN6659_c0_g1_i1.p1  ORF type:complete len:214 (-),score=5.84 TRINITY_DN6659_c0_g1_i1:512-1153(-)
MGIEDGTPDEIRYVYRSAPTADGRPLGLAAFAATTYVLSAYNAGWGQDIVWVGMALFYGGLGQLLAGMWQFNRDCVVTSTAFATYGCFWLSLGIFKVFELGGLLAKIDVMEANAWFLASFLAFNTYVLGASLMMCVAEAVVFALLELTLLCVMIGHFLGQPAGMDSSWTMAGGYLGIFTAIAAWYYSFACLINSMVKKQLIPVGSAIVKLAEE